MAISSSGARCGALPKLPQIAPEGYSSITDFFNLLKKVGRPLGATATQVGRKPTNIPAPARSKKPENPVTKKLKTSRVYYGKGEDHASMMAAVSEWDVNGANQCGSQKIQVRCEKKS